MARSIVMIALAVALPLGAQTKTTTTPTHRRTTAVATHKPAAAAEPGTKAVGDMPAAKGKPQDLYALKYIDLVVGTGELAQPNKFYTVHYTGWTLDGKKFDSSHDRDQPFVFFVGGHRVITAWDTGFDGMHVGGKRRLIVPYQLAYGVAGHPPAIPQKATLIFDVELLGQGDDAVPVMPPAAEANPAAGETHPN